MSVAARVAAPVASGPPAGGHAAFALALLLSCAFAFTGLFNHPLRAADEPRVAGIAWEIAHTGNVLVPHLGGEPFLEHPPLYYAALAATIHLFGSSEGMARVPGALAAAATLLLTFDLARRMASGTAGLMAVMVLSSTWSFFKFSHKVMVDSWLSAAVMLGYWAYARAACEGRPDQESPPRFVLLMYGAGALAFLVKGPVGVILLCGAVGLHALLARRWCFLRSKAHLPGLLLLAAGCAAWPAALYACAGREAFDAFFWQNVVYRIFPPVDVYGGGHEEPPWFYLLKLPAVVGPWIAVLPALGAWVLGAALPAGWNARMIRFGASVFPAGLLLLSLAGTKRTLYLLPALPPLAAAVGAWIASTPSRAPRQLAVLAFAVAVFWNVALRASGDAGRDLRPVALAIAAVARDGRPLVAYQLDEPMRGALPFYAGVILRNLHAPDEVRSFLRESPRGLVLQGDFPMPGFPGDLPELREIRSWPTAEGVYRVYELGAEGP